VRVHLYQLHWDTDECARRHTDSDIRRKPLEMAALLSCFIRDFSRKPPAIRYFVDAEYNQYIDWLLESKKNLEWVLALFKAFLDEYKFRFNKDHPLENLRTNFDDITKELDHIYRLDRKGSGIPPQVDRNLWRDDNKKPTSRPDKISLTNTYSEFYTPIAKEGTYTKRENPYLPTKTDLEGAVRQRNPIAQRPVFTEETLTETLANIRGRNG